MRKYKHMLVTGGAGFIGSNFIRYLFENTPFRGRVVNLDKLTYSGNLLNLRDIEEEHGGERYIFERGGPTGVGRQEGCALSPGLHGRSLRFPW